MCLYIHFTQVDVDGKKVSLFDSLEDTNSSDCLKTAQKIAGVTEAKSPPSTRTLLSYSSSLTLQALLRCCGDFFVLLLFNFFLVVLGKRKGKRGERETWRGRIDMLFLPSFLFPGPLPPFFFPPPPPLSSSSSLKTNQQKKKGRQGPKVCRFVQIYGGKKKE